MSQGTFSFTSEDTIIINNRQLTGLADGDCATVTYPNNTMEVKVGKNNNVIFAQNRSGYVAEMKLRVLRGCSDDKFLNGILANQDVASGSFVLLSGELVKLIGDGKGGNAADTTVLGAGVSIKNPDVKSNVEGDTNQAVVEYTFRFGQAKRVIT